MRKTVLNLSRTCAAILPAVLVLILSGTSRLDAADDGGYAGAFLRLDIGARAAGMGGAYAAIADGPAGFHYNPAGPAWATERAVEASYRKMGFDRQHGYVALLWPLRREAAIVGSWVHAGVSDVYERDLEGEKGDEINESNNAVSFTFSKRFTPFLSLGVNLRYVQMNIAGISAYTVGFDFGLMLKASPSDLTIGGPDGLTDFRLGVVLERVNYKYPWNTFDYWVKDGENGQSFEERWPVNVRIGGTVSALNQRGLLAVEVELNEETGQRFHAGVEGRVIPQLVLRAGLNGENLTAGVGIQTTLGLHTLYVDYAYTTTDDNIDDEHLISIGVRF